jgi:glutamate formiminotransferase / formiminotetrahydrofolate cyclodeaminase
MEKIIECVPNFSEGVDKSKIDLIIKEIEKYDVDIIGKEIGASTNRTVITFIGKAEKVIEAAFHSIKIAQQIIDMKLHKGEHPRMGACDVCPIVPLVNITMEECVELAKKLGKRVADELEIPVYLYEYAASSEIRKSLSYLRSGEYESLETKLKILKPDFGPTELTEKIKKSGATVIGARDILIAYNVNLNTKDKRIANEISQDIRESGKVVIDEKTKEKKNVSGRMKAVKAIGWYVEEFGIAQVSINLLNYKINSMHQVFDEIEKLAFKKGVRVTGSEVCGVVPLDSIIEAGKYYLKKQGLIFFFFF